MSDYTTRNTPAAREVPWPSVPALVRDASRRFGDLVAFVDDERSVTYAELEASMTRCARAIAAAGVEPGDRVVVWAPNSVRWVESVLGVLAAGARAVPLSTRLKGNEAAHAVRTSRARLLLGVDECLGIDLIGMLASSDPRAAGVPTVLLDGEERAGATSWASFEAEGANVDVATIEARIAALQQADVGFVLFTSGTTGRPKGAMLHHRALLLSAIQLRDGFALTPGDRMSVVLPFFHVFGLAILMANLATGTACWTTAGAFDPAAFAAGIERQQITFVPGPPPIFEAILAEQASGAHDLSSLRAAFVASTSVPGDLVRRLKMRGTFEHVVSGYGLTEGLIVSLNRLDEDIETTANWSGQVLPEAEVRVVDADGNDVASPSTPGELLVRTPSTTPGYFEAPEATVAALDSEGWFHTGDIGIVDERGYVRITDRKKDMFIVGGFNAYPAEIEEILREHPAVGQVAVVGRPDERMGEVGVAFVVPADPASFDADALLAWCRENMANYKVPRDIRVIDALPVTATMKVAKFELRRLLAGAA